MKIVDKIIGRIGKDKVKHFGVCLVLAVICPIVAVVVAVAKEVYDDGTEGNHFCWKDIVADVAGMAVGSAVHNNHVKNMNISN